MTKLCSSNTASQTLRQLRNLVQGFTVGAKAHNTGFTDIHTYTMQKQNQPQQSKHKLNKLATDKARGWGRFSPKLLTKQCIWCVSTLPDVSPLPCPVPPLLVLRLEVHLYLLPPASPSETHTPKAPNLRLDVALQRTSVEQGIAHECWNHGLKNGA